MGKKMLFLGMAVLFTAPFLYAEEIDFDYFYDSLAEHGEWIEMRPYGWVWSPSDVEIGWKPYAHGFWVYTDYGWTWESDEPWAWAVYHYGRWLYSDDYGWVWVPGTEWGPAWVAWRYSDECIGWAPLPPRVGWSVSAGLVVGAFNFDTDLDWSVWVFVEPRWFASPYVRRYYLHPVRNREWMGRTRIVVRYPYVNRRIFNPGYPIKDAERHGGRKIERRRVVETDGHRRVPRDRNSLPVYKPVVKKQRTPVPRSLPDKRKVLSEEDMRRKQEAEKRKFDDFYARRQREIRQPVAPPRKAPRGSVNRQRNTDEETRRLAELERKDRRVLDNKQNREREKLKKQKLKR